MGVSLKGLYVPAKVFAMTTHALVISTMRVHTAKLKVPTALPPIWISLLGQ